MNLDPIRSIKQELSSNERKLEDSMAHTREISKLVDIVEKTFVDKESEIANITQKLSRTNSNLNKVRQELVETKSFNKKRKEEISTLNMQLEREKNEVKELRLKLETAKTQLEKAERDLSESRSTVQRRKEFVVLSSEIPVRGRLQRRSGV